ncbi:hypothetical protein [Oceanobacillus sp. J11TS1]|uniref:hypothetical protein n=1 Tax=Oceanobacillus sp. J11TS1 TaxID=2807191 RepID=UPI001B1C9C28|nr:hypothetical protein [Oceanobacillus sp. J11TS1]GIO23112.1 hypothetical protein J11TS1_16930 [Oceanobacillus sp. J11TS1]
MYNQEKNQVIIQEILKWKENRLLSEEHCDFLLALYTKSGEIDIPMQGTIHKKNALWSLWKSIHLIMILFILVSVISLDYYGYLPWFATLGILSVGH